MKPPLTTRARLRVASSLVAAVVLLASGCTDDAPPGPPPGAPTFDQMARTLGSDVLRLVARGYVPGRSGEIVVIPQPWNVLGQWNGGLRGPDDPRAELDDFYSVHRSRHLFASDEPARIVQASARDPVLSRISGPRARLAAG